MENKRKTLDELISLAEETNSITDMRWAQYGKEDGKTVSALELSERDGSIVGGGPIAEAVLPKFAEYMSTFDPVQILELLKEVKESRRKLNSLHSAVMWDSEQVYTDIRGDYSNSYEAINSKFVENILKS